MNIILAQTESLCLSPETSLLPYLCDIDHQSSAGKVPARMMGVSITSSLLMGFFTKACFFVFLLVQLLLIVGDEVKFSIVC